MSQEITIPNSTEWREVASYTAHNEQVRIHAGDDARATVLLNVHGTVDVQVHVQGNASLCVVCLQEEDAIITQSSHIAEGATMHWQNISLAPVQQKLASHVEGDNATSNIDWILFAAENEQQAAFATNAFSAAAGGGEITLKGVAQDSAHMQCRGMIDIALGATQTDTYLHEDVLMLDSTAKVDAIPGLEIKTNDVKASHSATVSRVTAEDLFYFASRGITKAEARHMYVQGFLSDLTERITHEEVREIVLSAIGQKYLRHQAAS